MKAEFVRTPEFDEGLNQIKSIMRYLSKPRNLICALFNTSLWVAFYLMMIVIADTWR